ncbi:MAG: hypothetical protein ACW967_09405, partial [Candidatus Hodarchaeales archaeon]
MAQFQSSVLVIVGIISFGVTILLTPFIIIYNQKKVSEYNTLLISRLTQRIYQSEKKLELLKEEKIKIESEDIQESDYPEEKVVKTQESDFQVDPKTVIEEKPALKPSVKAPEEFKRLDLSQEQIKTYKESQVMKTSPEPKVSAVEVKIEQVQKRITERELGGYNLESWLLFGTVGFIVLAISLIIGSIILENIPKIETNILFNAGDLLFFLTIVGYLLNLIVFYAPIISKYREYRKIGFLITGLLGLISLFVIRFSTSEIEVLKF